MASTPCAEGIEAIMFRTIGDAPPAWESLLPAEVLRLPEELARVDALLDDPVFFAPFARYFHPVLGRPGTPVEWYLRLMFLKFRHGLGFESLCAEVSDSGQLAAVLPDPARWEGPASDDADEADQPVRGGRGGGSE
jgi:transposase, IS5 family